MSELAIGDTDRTRSTGRSRAVSRSAGRIGAMVLRYWWLLVGSWPRILSLIYWPVVSMVMWGFVQKFIQSSGSSSVTAAMSFLIGAVILWDILFRGQIGFSMSFFEEIWSRNLGHLLVSPLRLWEFIAALTTASFARAVLSLIPASLMAIWMFNFSVWAMGPALALFFLSLIMFGWALGLCVAGLVTRFGQSAEEIAWGIVFTILPLCGVYYPTSVLPGALRWISFGLPPKYVFDAMRQILRTQSFDPNLLVAAYGLDLVYLAFGGFVFLLFLHQARNRGILLSVGE
jgi:ABC-2 type transport system permease protein